MVSPIQGSCDTKPSDEPLPKKPKRIDTLGKILGPYLQRLRQEKIFMMAKKEAPSFAQGSSFCSKGPGQRESRVDCWLEAFGMPSNIPVYNTQVLRPQVIKEFQPQNNKQLQPEVDQTKGFSEHIGQPSGAPHKEKSPTTEKSTDCCPKPNFQLPTREIKKTSIEEIFNRIHSHGFRKRHFPSKPSMQVHYTNPAWIKNEEEVAGETECQHVSDRRLSLEEEKELVKPLIPLLRNIRIRLNQANRYVSKNEWSQGNMEKQWFDDDNMTPRGKRLSGVKLTKPGYSCFPDLQQLDQLTNDITGQCMVRDFEIRHYLRGKVVVQGYCDVAGLDLDDIVDFECPPRILYANNVPKPPFGYGLNRPYTVTMNDASTSIKAECHAQTFRDALETYAKKENLLFENYCPLMDAWTYTANMN